MTATPHTSMTTAGSHRAPVDLFEPEAAGVQRTAAHRALDPTPSVTPVGPETPNHASRHRTSPKVSHAAIYRLLTLVIGLVLVALALLRFG